MTETPQPWAARHELHVYGQTESRPNPATGWWERQSTHLIHLLCNCGYSTGWIPRDQMPSREQLLSEHGTPAGATATDATVGAADREAVAQWLTANGIDPGDVPLPSRITIERDVLYGQRRIRYTMLLRNEAGSKYIDFSTGDAAMEERTTPLKVEPPTNVLVRSSN